MLFYMDKKKKHKYEELLYGIRTHFSPVKSTNIMHQHHGIPVTTYLEKKKEI
jgi:hypothetical protein